MLTPSLTLRVTSRRQAQQLNAAVRTPSLTLRVTSLNRKVRRAPGWRVGGFALIRDHFQLHENVALGRPLTNNNTTETKLPEISNSPAPASDKESRPATATDPSPKTNTNRTNKPLSKNRCRKKMNRIHFQKKPQPRRIRSRRKLTSCILHDG